MSDDVTKGVPAELKELEDYSDREDRLSVYEYVGMLTASLGFFVPVLTLPVARYCAYRIREWKPATALVLVAVALTTIVFWVVVVVFVIQPPFISRTLDPLPGVDALSPQTG